MERVHASPPRDRACVRGSRDLVHAPWAWLGTAWLVLVLGACDRQDVVAFARGAAADDAGARGDGAIDGDAGAGRADAEPGDGGACRGRGPIVQVGDGTLTCGGRVAARRFRYAVCTCDDYSASAPLTTDSFDSTRGPYTAGGRGGSVGVNGRVAAAAPLSLGGALWAGGSGLQAGSGGDVIAASDVRVRGPVESEAVVRVGRDAYFGARVQARELVVTGTLTRAPGVVLDVSGSTQLGGEREAPVDVPPPCECGVDELLDVAELVRAQRDDHDNATIGLDPRALEGRTGARTLALPCGRYYLTNIGGTGALTLQLTGRVVLFVDGDVALDAPWVVELGADAELDLFVAGNVLSSSTIRFGSAEAPARARLYVGGRGTLQLGADAVFGGNLYAPRAELTTSGRVEVFGSLFVRRLAASGPLSVHYDTAVLDPKTAECGAPPVDTCTSACDCAGGACVGGTCGACASHADCCAPLFCSGGRCVADPF